MSPQRPSSHRRHRKARTAASTSPRLPVRTARRAESAGCVQTTQTAHRQARTYTPNGKHALSVSSMSVDVECCRWQALATSGHCRSGQWLVRTHGSRGTVRCVVMFRFAVHTTQAQQCRAMCRATYRLYNVQPYDLSTPTPESTLVLDEWVLRTAYATSTADREGAYCNTAVCFR